MTNKEVESIIEVVSVKIKELGPAGEIAINDVAGYIKIEALWSMIGPIILALIFSIITIVGFIWAKQRKEIEDWDEKKDTHVGKVLGIVFGILTIISLLSINLSGNLSKYFHPLGYYISKVTQIIPSHY